MAVKTNWINSIWPLNQLLGTDVPADVAKPERATNAQILAHGQPTPGDESSGADVSTTDEAQKANDEIRAAIRERGEVEHGVSGTQFFGGKIRSEEYNPVLLGPKGMAIYDRMRKSDAQVRASLQVVKLPLRAAVWCAIKPEHGDAIDEQIAMFVQANLFDGDGMQDSWDFVLRHILLKLDFGFSVLEKVWQVDELTGEFRIKRLAPRLPRTISEWETRRDGTLVRIWQYVSVTDDGASNLTLKNIDSAPSGTLPPGLRGGDHSREMLRRPGSVPAPPRSHFQYLPIPAHAVCVFSNEREGDNYEGMSILRPAHKHWFYKDLIYHLESVRLDRFGVGIPTAELTDEHTLRGDDLAALHTTLRNLRANEQVYLVAPPGVRYRILGPESKTSAANSAQSMIDHHDSMIARNVLAGFMTMGQERGTIGFGSRLTDLFISSLYGVAAGICADLKQSVVKQLCDLNYNMTGREYPNIIVRDLEMVDLERLATVALKAVGTLITPDDDLESALRKGMRLPPLADELSRKTKREREETSDQRTREREDTDFARAGGARYRIRENEDDEFEVVDTTTDTVVHTNVTKEGAEQWVEAEEIRKAGEPDGTIVDDDDDDDEQARQAKIAERQAIRAERS